MRKRVLIFMAVGLLCGASWLMAQDVPGGVIVAFKKGNSQELNKYMGEKVDMTIQDQFTSADKQTALAEMTNFFTSNKVKGFNVNHQGKRNESSFIVGTLNTVNGSFRVNCFFRKEQNKYYIQQLRIDKTND